MSFALRKVQGARCNGQRQSGDHILCQVVGPSQGEPEGQFGMGPVIESVFPMLLYASL